MKKIRIPWDTLLVYFGTFSGIVFSAFVALKKAGKPIDFSSLRIEDMIVSAFIALLFVLQDETGVLDPKSDVSPQIKRDAKRQNLKRRLLHAIVQGLGWTALIN